LSLEDICNEDLTVGFSNTSGPPDLIYTSDPGIDATKVVPVKSTKCKIDGKSVCTTAVTITWTVATGGCPFTSATYDFVAGAASILPGATKTKAENALVLRNGDASESGCIGSWTLKASPYTAMACACDCSISAAGQNNVKAQ
jgi:hypothetical protein